MSISKVEYRRFAGPAQVDLGGVGKPTIVEMRFGPKGDEGDAATVTIGTTTTGAAGTNASVTNSGSTSAAVLNFTIPRGLDGENGPNSVTSATTTDINGILIGNGTNVYEAVDGIDYLSPTSDGSQLTGLVSAQITDASTLPVYNETTELFDEVAVLFDENGSLNANSFLAGVDGFHASNVDDFASFSMSASPINFKIGTKQFRFNQPVGNGGQYTVPDGTGTLALTSSASGGIVSADITDATTTGEANKLVKVNAGGNLVCDILFANSSLDVGSEGNQSGIINVVNASGDVGRITNENEANGVELRFPTAGTGTQHQIVVTSDLNGRADKVHDGTISGTTTINSTSYTYGTGAAAAHRDALGVAGKQSKTTSTAITSTNGTPTDVTDLTGFTLEANATYRLTVWSLISTASGGSFEYIFECSGTTYLGGTAQAGSGVFRSGGVLGGGYHYTNLRFSPLYATQNLTSGHTYGEYYFRTAGTAGTAKMLFSQRSSAVAGTTTVAAGATVILEKIS